MNEEKIKPPRRPTNDNARAWNHYTSSQERFRSNYYEYTLRSYKPVRAGSPTFGSYDLETHGVNYPGSYSGSAVSKIIRERSGEPYLLGIELEIERASDRAGISQALKKYLPDRHVCVSDGSLRDNGIEIVTSPIAPREISRIAWYSLLRSLSRAGAVSHDSGRCGLHVSISRSFLSDRTWKDLRSFLTREKLFFESVSRRERGEREGDPFYYCQFQNRTAKYTALNLSKGAVCEFRFFRGTLKPQSFIASIEIVRSLVEYAKGIELSRENGKRSRFTPKGWISVVSQFPVAWGYCKDRIDLLGTRGESVNRRRLTPRERIWRNYTDLQCYGRSGPVIQAVEVGGSWDLAINDPSGWAFSYNMRSGEREAERSYRIPINWNRGGLPLRFGNEADRGYMPTHLIVTTPYGLNTEGVEAVIDYQRGGWGDRSRVSPTLRPIRSVAVSN